MGWEREPFLSVWPLLSVALFALNNFWLKHAYPSWLTGKLSDVCACFFLPLYIAWMLREMGATTWSIERRMRVGAWITGGLLMLVKATALGSAMLNALVTAVTTAAPFRLVPNRTDATDLIALPMVLLALWFARRTATEAQQLTEEKP